MSEGLAMIAQSVIAAAWWNLFVRVYRRRQQPTMAALAWVAIVFSIWTTLSLIQLHTTDLAARELLLRAILFVGLIAPVSWWLLTLRLAAPAWLKGWQSIAFLVPAIVNAVAAALWPLDGPFIRDLGGRWIGDRLALEWSAGPALAWFALPYAYALLLAAVAGVLYLGLAVGRIERRTSLALALAMVFPVAGAVLQLTGRNPLPTYEITGLLLGVSVGLLYLVVAHSERLDARTVAYGAAFAAITEPALISSSRGEVLDANPAMRKLLEREGPIEGATLAEVAPEFEEMRLAGRYEEASYDTLSGRFLGFRPSLSPVHDRRGRQIACVVILRDVRASLEREAALRDAAHRDPLTGVANRLGFEAALAASLRDPPEAGFGIIFIDLDHFKPVNDEHGHLAGDAALIEIAKRLSELVRSGDVAARLGGDEFGVLIRNPRSEDLDAVAARIEGAISMPIHYDGHTLTVGASVGVARAPVDGEKIDDLMRVADTRMYRRKRSRTDPGTGQ